MSNDPIREGDDSVAASSGSFSACADTGQDGLPAVDYRRLVAELQLHYRLTSPRQVFEIYPDLGPPWEAEIRAVRKKS